MQLHRILLLGYANEDAPDRAAYAKALEWVYALM
jgi:hypothetical protein